VVVPEPVEEPVVVPEEEEPLPEPEVTEEVALEEAPEPITEPEEEVEEEVIPEPEPEPEVVPEVVPVEELEEETVVLDNGVVLTQEQAVAIALLQDPAALLQELFTNPAAALAALGQVGADMSPEVREDSEKVIISAIIAGNIATQAAASAGALAALRRKP
jgi:outer membrane biosynthesis protein TonB